MKDKNKRGIGLKYALNGILEAIKRERNFRIHLVAATIIILVSFYFQINIWEWMILIILINMVLLMELINSVIERIIDYIKPEYHPEAKIIKDISAAIVLIAAITSVIIGSLIFLPKFFN